MKKEELLFFIVLFILMIKNVSAFGVKIANHYYPWFIMIPLILLFMCLILLIVLFLKDFLKKSKSKISETEVQKRIERVIIEKLGEGEEVKKRKKSKRKGIIEKFNLFGKKENKERQEELDKKFANFEKDIIKFKRQLKILKLREAIDRFSEILKRFFRNILELNYEFTYEELIKELEKKKKEKLVSFSKRVSDFMYSGEKISKNQLMELVNEFERILRNEFKQKEGITARRNGKKLSKKMGWEVSKEQLLELLKTEKKLSEDIERTKKTYSKIFLLYNQLPKEEKKKVYPKIRKFLMKKQKGEIIKEHEIKKLEKPKELKKVRKKKKELKRFGKKIERQEEKLKRLEKKLKKLEKKEENKRIKELKKMVLKT